MSRSAFLRYFANIPWRIWSLRPVKSTSQTETATQSGLMPSSASDADQPLLATTNDRTTISSPAGDMLNVADANTLNMAQPEPVMSRAIRRSFGDIPSRSWRLRQLELNSQTETAGDTLTFADKTFTDATTQTMAPSEPESQSVASEEKLTAKDIHDKYRQANIKDTEKNQKLLSFGIERITQENESYSTKNYKLYMVFNALESIEVNPRAKYTFVIGYGEDGKPFMKEEEMPWWKPYWRCFKETCIRVFQMSNVESLITRLIQEWVIPTTPVIGS